MVQALAFLLPFPGAVTFAGVTLMTATGTLTLAGSLVNLGAGLLLSNLSRPDVPDAARPQNIQRMSKAAAAPRVAHYGTVKVGGTVVFDRAQDGFSYRLVVLGHGQISGVQQHYLNNEPVALDGSGFVTDAQYQLNRSRVQILGRSGQVPETAFAEITARWPEWTVNHRLDGLWTALVIAESVGAQDFRAMYPQNEPALQVLAQTKSVYDPRSDTTSFSENAALIIADYLAAADGFNRADAFAAGNIAAQAEICDLDIPLAVGGTEKNYRLSGSYLLNEKPQNVLGRMLAACGGRIRLTPAGKLALEVGTWVPPTVTIGYGEIIGIESFSAGPDLLDRYNELPARFTSHALGHIEVDAEPWRDATRVAEDGAVLVGPEKNLIMCPTHRQARQVMKIATERDNPKLELTLICKPRALMAVYEPTVTLTAPELGLTGDFELAGHNLIFDKGHLAQVVLHLRKTTAGAFALALAEQGAVQLAPTPDSRAVRST